jgi:hypothetical protein
MPFFDGDGGYRRGAVEVPHVEVVLVLADGSRRRFHIKDLLNSFDVGLQGTVALKYLSPLQEQEPRSSSGLKGYLRRLALRLLPGLHRGQWQRDDPDNRASLREWLQRRAGELLPDQPVARVEFEWSTQRVSVVDGQRRATLTPLGVFAVPLGTDTPRQP